METDKSLRSLPPTKTAVLICSLPPPLTTLEWLAPDGPYRISGSVPKDASLAMILEDDLDASGDHDHPHRRSCRSS